MFCYFSWNIVKYFLLFITRSLTLFYWLIRSHVHTFVISVQTIFFPNYFVFLSISEISLTIFSLATLKRNIYVYFFYIDKINKNFQYGKSIIRKEPIITMMQSVNISCFMLLRNCYAIVVLQKYNRHCLWDICIVFL